MYKTITDLNLEGKRVLVRLDLNVPIKEGQVKDTTRIDASLPTIKHIIENKGKAILMSHLGRPGGERKSELSLAPVAKVISEKLGKEVKIAEDSVGESVNSLVEEMKEGEIIVLENLRFHKEEEENEEGFAKSLSELADVYINDAFGTAHRAHASTCGVPVELKKQNKSVAAGFLMSKELEIWDPIVNGSGKSVAVVGGAKLKEKMKAVKKFSEAFDRIILGGVVANVFLNAKGVKIGSSRYLEKDKDYTDKAKELLGKDNIILPSKSMLATTSFEKKGVSEIKDLEEGMIFADVIPSEEDISAIKQAERMVWFGPMGAYEFGCTEGSQAIVKGISESDAYVVIGGGDLAAAAKGVRAKVSTGGGASIQYITTGKLEALEALELN